MILLFFSKLRTRIKNFDVLKFHLIESIKFSSPIHANMLSFSINFLTYSIISIYFILLISYLNRCLHNLVWNLGRNCQIHCWDFCQGDWCHFLVGHQQSLHAWSWTTCLQKLSCRQLLSRKIIDPINSLENCAEHF